MNMADDRLQTCPFCLTDIHELATVCTGCGAARRRIGAPWIRPRSAARVDVMVGVLGAVAVIMLISFGASIMLAELYP